MNKKLTAAIFLLCNCASLSFANIRLPNFVGDNMVLQRDIEIPVWGWADPGEKIVVKFLNETYSTSSDKEGNWKVKIASTKAGGPYEMLLLGKNEIKIRNILIGDVWFCGGQSNMEWTFNMMPTKYNDEVAQSGNSNIRLITIDKRASKKVQKELFSEGWKLCNPANLNNFSAVGYFFGKDIYDKIKVPIGLISDNWGGTPAEAWMSYEALNNFPHYQKMLTDSLGRNEKLNEWTEKAHQMDQASLSDTSWALVNDFKQWNSINVPGAWQDELRSFDGVVWLKKEIFIPKDAEGKEATMTLSFIDDKDITYFNGKKIGSSEGYDVSRYYTIPGNLVKEGKNVISIRISDYWGGGGMSGDPSNLKLEVIAGSLKKFGNWNYSLSLSGQWKYKISKKFEGLGNKPILGYYSPPNISNTPTTLYNAMLAPIIPYAIKGVIWYQGEGNTGRAFEYRTLLPALIKDWRAQWDIGDFPFLIVQLANFTQPKANPEEDEWAELREAQAMALSLPNTGMAVAIDVGQAEDIHPWNKKDVGKRLALAGLKVAYGQDIVYSGPVYESMKIEGNKIRIKFKNVGTGLSSKNGELKEFAIAGEEKKFEWANAKIEDDNTVLIWSDKINKPVAVRYAWQINPSKANLYNKEGLPASPFRTDTWKGITERY